MPNINVLHQIRKNRKGRGISIFVQESLFFKKQKDLGINLEAVESFSIEISNKRYKNIILNTIYRSLNRYIETCENYFKNLIAKNCTVNKNIKLVSNFI